MASNKIPRTCQQCGKSFEMPACNLKYGRGKFCGLACRKTFMEPLLEQRFWSKVNKTETCWLWTGSTANKGYGSVGIRTKGHVITRGAHCVSYELNVGPIPDGLCVLHHCDNPPCVRPDHLYLGTKKDNTADMDRRGRRSKNQSGHHRKLTEDQVCDIRTRHESGEVNQTELGAIFGVHSSTIHLQSIALFLVSVGLISGNSWNASVRRISLNQTFLLLGRTPAREGDSKRKSEV